MYENVRVRLNVYLSLFDKKKLFPASMYRLFYKYIYTLSTYYIIKERERERQTINETFFFLIDDGIQVLLN